MTPPPPPQVRTAACKAVCAAALSHPGLIPDEGPRDGRNLAAVSMRMLDTRPGVRRAAAAALLVLFRTRIAKGEIPGCCSCLCLLT